MRSEEEIRRGRALIGVLGGLMFASGALGAVLATRRYLNAELVMFPCIIFALICCVFIFNAARKEHLVLKVVLNDKGEK